jgi:hypothetical protein
MYGEGRTEWVSLRTDKSGELYEHGTDMSGFIKFGEFAE